MPLITLGDILDETADYVGSGGVSTDCEGDKFDEAVRQINRATRLLLKSGRHEGSYDEICLTSCDGCITLDRRFEAIHSYLIDGNEGHIDSMQWKYSEMTSSIDKSCNFSSGSNLEWLGANFPVHNELTEASYLTFTSDRPEDEDLSIRIQGADENGRPVHIDGIKGAVFSVRHSLDSPTYTGTDGYWSGKFSRISAIKKDKSKGYVSVWAFCPMTGKVTWVTSLAPDETSPALTRYRVPGVSHSCCAEIKALVKLRYVPLHNRDDVALIQDMDAFIYMMKSLKEEENENLEKAARYKAAALRQLDLKTLERTRGQRKAIRIQTVRAPSNIKHRYF